MQADPRHSAQHAGIAPEYAAIVEIMEAAIPFNKHLGLRVRTLQRGLAVITMPWTDFMTGDPWRPAMHGGVIAAVLDTAGGAACWTMLDRLDGRLSGRLSTVDLRVDYLRPGPNDAIFCQARVVRMGNRVAVARMELFSEVEAQAQGNRAATARGEAPTTPHEGLEPIATGQAVYNIAKARG